MATFIYIAKNKQGKNIKGTIEAATLKEAHTLLETQGIYPISVRKAKRKIRVHHIPTFSGRVSTEELIIFTEQFATLITSGLSILETLTGLADQMDNKFFKNVILDIKKMIEQGSSLRDAFAKYNKVFPPLYIKLLTVGEATGRLDIILKGIASYIERDDALKKKIKSAFTYPKFVITIVTAVVIFLILYVLPKFSSIYAQAREQLPTPTRMLLNFKDFLVHDWLWIIVAIVALYFTYKAIYATKKGRYTIDKYKLKLPLFGRIIKFTAFSRFAHSFSLTLESGISIVDALSIAAEVTVNGYIIDELGIVREDVKEGKSLSEAMRARKSIPKIMVQMAAVGEKSGNLDSLMEKLAELWDRNIDYTVKNLAAKLEPTMIIILGVIVGFVALAMYLPMFGLPGAYRKTL